jgi:hypothetical protein
MCKAMGSISSTANLKKKKKTRKKGREGERKGGRKGKQNVRHIMSSTVSGSEDTKTKATATT